MRNIADAVYVAWKRHENQERADAPRRRAGLRTEADATLRVIGNTTPPPRAVSDGMNGASTRSAMRDRISQAERRPPEAPDEQVPHADAEARRGKSPREQKCGEHQPYRHVAEPGQRLRRRQRAAHRQERHREDDADAHADGLRDQRDDGREEDREQVLLLRVQAGNAGEPERGAGVRSRWPTARE